LAYVKLFCADAGNERTFAFESVPGLMLVCLKDIVTYNIAPSLQSTWQGVFEPNIFNSFGLTKRIKQLIFKKQRLYAFLAL
jgi:hypothetical protein